MTTSKFFCKEHLNSTKKMGSTALGLRSLTQILWRSTGYKEHVLSPLRMGSVDWEKKANGKVLSGRVWDNLLCNNPFVRCIDFYMKWFSKTLTGLYPGRKFQQGDQTKDGEKEGEGRSHQPEAEKTENDCPMLIMLLPCGKVYIGVWVNLKVKS